MEGTPEEQRQQLKEEYERNLAQIKNDTAESGGYPSETAPVPDEHKAMAKAVEGVIQEHVSDYVAPVGPSQEPTPEAQAKIQAWRTEAAEKGYSAVIKEVRNSDPALMDDLHAALTGDLYRELVERGMLEAVK